MTPQEVKAIEEIRGTGGFRVIQSLAEDMLAKAKDVTLINRDAMVAEQAIARQLTYEVLKQFLSELKLTSPPIKETKKTFE